jgi:hypothetical protein
MIAPEEFPVSAPRKTKTLKPFQELVEKKNQEVAVSEETEMDKDTQNFIKEKLLYKGYDPAPEKLVQRPERDVVWGLGGELLRRKTSNYS